jgi:hypothetical protein
MRALGENAKERVVVGQTPARRQNPKQDVESPDILIIRHLSPTSQMYAVVFANVGGRAHVM